MTLFSYILLVIAGFYCILSFWWINGYNISRSNMFCGDDTKEYLKTKPTYSPPCRMGDWALNLAIQEEQKKVIDYKRRHHQLLVGKTRNMLRKVMEPTTLSAAVEELRYGDLYQILAPEVPNGVDLRNTKTKGLYLSALVNGDDIDLGIDIMQGCMFTASPERTACRRNTFSMISSQYRTGYICYGEEFYLQLKGEQPLYVEAQSATMDTFGSPMYVRLTGSPDVYCNFKIIDRRPSMRKSSFGMKVLPNTNVIIQHVQSGLNLAVDIYNWIPTFFGPECLIKCANFRDQNRIETAENVWKIVSKREPDKGLMIRAAKGENIPSELLEKRLILSDTYKTALMLLRLRKDMDVFCLDIGAHSVKVCILLESGDIITNNELKVHSTVTVNVGENDMKFATHKDFVPMINMSLQAMQKTTMNAVNIKTDNDNYLKTKDSDLYFDELLAFLFENIRSKNSTKYLMKTIATSLPQSKTLTCAAILSGVKHHSVPEYNAIANAYLSTKPRNSRTERYVLAIDLGYSSLKIYKIKIIDKAVKYEMESYPVSSHEFTLALFNYVMDKGKTGNTSGLLDECEMAKVAFSNEKEYYYFDNNVQVLRTDFEKCIKPIVQRLISKCKEFLVGDSGWDGDVVLIGSSFNIPLVSSAVKSVLKDAVFVNLNVDFEYVIAYGIAVHMKNRY